MTLRAPSASAALTSSSMPPIASAEVAVAAFEDPPPPLHAATTTAMAASETSEARTRELCTDVSSTTDHFSGDRSFARRRDGRRDLTDFPLPCPAVRGPPRPDGLRSPRRPGQPPRGVRWIVHRAAHSARLDGVTILSSLREHHDIG